MNKKLNVLIILFAGLAPAISVAEPICIPGYRSGWEDASGKHRSAIAYSTDFSSCQKKFEAEKQAPTKPGPPGQYYFPQVRYIRREMAYIQHACLPQHGWRWIVTTNCSHSLY